VIDDAVEIFQRFARVDYLRHLTGLGFRVVRPAAFASR
jgi:hypothetical protein